MGAGTVALAVLGGCAGPPPGTDGMLADDWPGPPKPAVVVPRAEVCHNNVTGYALVQVVTIVTEVTKPCTESHLAETVHVGTFTGEAASRVTGPSASSPEVRAAYAECVTKATAFLGDDYRIAFVELYVVLPSSTAWGGGARWFRCDLVEYEHLSGSPSNLNRTASLKGTLAPGGAPRADCWVITDRPGTDVGTAAAACTAAHNGELAGLYLAPDVPAPSDSDAEQLAGNCAAVVAKYAGIPNDRNLFRRIRYVYTWPTDEDWSRGNRAFSCYLWMPKNATRLMKGAGPGAFPAS